MTISKEKRMEFSAELLIEEIRLTRAMNVPVQIVLATKELYLDQNMRSHLNVSSQFLKDHDIPLLTGSEKHRVISCRLKSRQLPLQAKGQQHPGFIDMSSLTEKDLRIRSIESNEKITYLDFTAPPQKVTQETRLMHLHSFGGGDGIHPTLMPCPFYNLKIYLSQGQYRDARLLPPGTVFSVSFAFVK